VDIVFEAIIPEKPGPIVVKAVGGNSFGRIPPFHLSLKPVIVTRPSTEEARFGGIRSISQNWIFVSVSTRTITRCTGESRLEAGGQIQEFKNGCCDWEGSPRVRNDAALKTSLNSITIGLRVTLVEAFLRLERA
jgi:hypothetical protein